jgi:hypothetical protein
MKLVLIAQLADIYTKNELTQHQYPISLIPAAPVHSAKKLRFISIHSFVQGFQSFESLIRHEDNENKMASVHMHCIYYSLAVSCILPPVQTSSSSSSPPYLTMIIRTSESNLLLIKLTHYILYIWNLDADLAIEKSLMFFSPPSW